MSRAAKPLTAVWEFVVGDDWRIALGVACALALTALIAGAGVPAWWVMPVAVLGLLALSIRGAARNASKPALSSTVVRPRTDSIAAQDPS